jgi:hypothetical protein
MPILNYTTTIDAHKTVTDVQRLLAKRGARAIMFVPVEQESEPEQ